jgi:hypothetical protein
MDAKNVVHEWWTSHNPSIVDSIPTGPTSQPYEEPESQLVDHVARSPFIGPPIEDFDLGLGQVKIIDFVRREIVQRTGDAACCRSSRCSR